MDDGSLVPSREDELAAQAFKEIFPNGLPSARPAAGSAIVRTFPLSVDNLHALGTHVASGEKLSVETQGLRKTTTRHRRLAQLLAMGMEDGKAGLVCGYTATTVSILKSDPLFQELVDYYQLQVEEEFVGVAEAMAELHEDTIAELRDRLENNPSQFTVGSLTELMKALADRTGHGVQSNLNVKATTLSLNGADLERIKSTPTPGASRPFGSAGQLSEEDRRSLGSVFTLSANDVRIASPQGVGAGERERVREEGHPQAEDGVVANPGGTEP